MHMFMFVSYNCLRKEQSAEVIWHMPHGEGKDW